MRGLFTRWKRRAGMMLPMTDHACRLDPMEDDPNEFECCVCHTTYYLIDGRYTAMSLSGVLTIG